MLKGIAKKRCHFYPSQADYISFFFSKSMSDSNFELYIKPEIAITEKISLGRSYHYVPL